MLLTPQIKNYLIKYSSNTLIHAHSGSQHPVGKAQLYKFCVVQPSLFSSLHQRLTATIQHVLKSQTSSTLPLFTRHWIAAARVDFSLSSQCLHVRNASQCLSFPYLPGVLLAPKGFALYPSIHTRIYTNLSFLLLVRCPTKLFSPPKHTSPRMLNLKSLLVIFTVTTRTT